MFREMRRSRQQLSPEECEFILNNNTSGVLSVIGDDGYPYGVPLSYAFKRWKIYFHCALEGHKLDAIGNCDKVSFCVIDRDDVKPMKFTTYYRSVITFGRAHIVSDNTEKKFGLHLLSEKFSHGLGDEKKEIENGIDRLVIVEMQIEHLTGKCAKELPTGT